MPDTKKRILLVDDHVDTLRMCALVVIDLGHMPVTSTSFEGAIRICDGQPIDLLVADIRFRDGEGWEMLRHVRKHCRVPAIGISGVADDAKIHAGLAAGFDVYLTKPFDVLEFEETVVRMLKPSPAG
jgi:DNA-binding response OmpR family regulator